MSTDVTMRLPAAAVADAQSAYQPRTYAFSFGWPAAPHLDLGACHAIELPFVFGTLDRQGWDTFVAADADAHALSRRLRSAWAAFARTGDPSTDDPWPPYAPPRRATRVFARRDRLDDDPLATQRRLWDALLAPQPIHP
jgi:para-nitrobenzyl esterase